MAIEMDSTCYMDRDQITHIYRTHLVKVEKFQDRVVVLSKVLTTSLTQGQPEHRSIHRERGFQPIISKEIMICNRHLTVITIQCLRKEP